MASTMIEKFLVGQILSVSREKFYYEEDHFICCSSVAVHSYAQKSEVFINNGYAANGYDVVAYFKEGAVIGGFLIVIGLFTRIAVILQYRFSLGHNFLLIQKAGFSGESDLLFSIIVLVLLLFSS